MIKRKRSGKKQKFVVDWELFGKSIERRTARESETIVKTGSRILKEAYRESQKTENRTHKKMPYWWNETIGIKHSECKNKRRATIRARGAVEREERKAAYKRGKKELKGVINLSKKKQWQEICDDLDKDIWGNGYKIVSGRMCEQTPIELALEKRIETANHHSRGRK